MMVTGALYGLFCEDVVCVGAVCVHFGVFPGDSGQFGVISGQFWSKMLHFLKNKKTPRLSTQLAAAVTAIVVSSYKTFLFKSFHPKSEWTNCLAWTI